MSENMLTRKGVGKALMSQVIKEMKERDLHTVYAYVRRDNKVNNSKYSPGNIEKLKSLF